MSDHLGDDVLDGLAAAAAELRKIAPAHRLAHELDLAATEIQQHRQLGTWDLPQHDGYWMDRNGKVWDINVSGLTGERSEWFYRQLGPWRRVTDYTVIVSDVDVLTERAERKGRLSALDEIRAVIAEMTDF